MSGKQAMFFAIADDLYSILEETENGLDIEYVEMGRFESRNLNRYSSFSKIPNLGRTDWGSWVGLDHHYLVKPSITQLNVEEFKLSSGGVAFLVDQKENPASIELTTGGIYTKKQRVIVAGRVATISDDPASVQMYNLLSNKIKKRFKRIEAFYIGPKAEEKLKEGWRLVTNEKSPQQYDLVLSD